MMRSLYLFVVAAAAAVGAKQEQPVANTPTRDCAGVASALNTAFASSTRYDPKTEASLEAYLSKNGLLVTMCSGITSSSSDNTTSCDEAMDHVSASWMSDPLTGFRTLPTSFGAVIDPLRVTVTCAYPVDASTDARENMGCGPHKLDPYYGSQGYYQSSPAGVAAVRAEAQSFYSKVGADSWTDAPCSQFVAEVQYLSAVTSLTNNDNTLSELASYNERLFGDWYGLYLGHPYCLDDSPRCVGTGRCGALDYLGNTSWSPDEFDAMVDAQLTLHEKNPTLIEASWNEIVLQPKETLYYDAVFWLNDTRVTSFQRKLAQTQAHTLAAATGVPVLVGTLPWLADDPDADNAPWGKPPTLVFACDAAE